MVKKIILTVGLVLVVLGAVMFSAGSKKPGHKIKFINASPIDLSQTARISVFRSCVGHDYSGFGPEGEHESNRSMKHYIDPIGSLERSQGQVKAFAPFDGRVTTIETDQNPRGRQIWLEPFQAPGWQFIFFHVDPLTEIQKGSKVEAGRLLGYANLKEAANFDIGLKYFRARQIFDSPFNFMTGDLLAEYAIFGLTPDNIIIKKSKRDSRPCSFGQGSGEEDYLELKTNR